MPNGKLANTRCAQLTVDNRCAIFGDPRRPAVCSNLRASVEMCGDDPNVVATHTYAMKFLLRLERETGAN
jgi:uncharacterized protein